MAKEFPRILAESKKAIVNVSASRMIGSLVTIHGNRVLMDISMEKALCIRMIYWAMACHSAHGSIRCQDLHKLEDIAPLITEADSNCRFNVSDTLPVLWKWFGDHPIFVGLDAELECKYKRHCEAAERPLSGCTFDTG